MKIVLRNIPNIYPTKLKVAVALVLGLFITFTYTPSTSHAQEISPSGVFNRAPCMVDLPAGFQEGINVECGYLIVPENHSSPSGSQIELGVMIIRADAENRDKTPIFFAQGGPGGSTIDTYARLLLNNNSFIGQRDLVLWDQRGTLYSNPFLRCQEFFDATLDTLDTVLPDDEERQLTLDITQQCYDRLSSFTDLSNFDSLQNAADIEALRKALGYDQVSFYGVSYGTLLGFHLMNNYPEKIQSVILDGVVPPQENFILNAGQTMNRSFSLLFEACSLDAKCNQAYPELEQVFYDVINRLNNEPARLQVVDPETATVYPLLLDGDTFLNTIFQIFYVGEYLPLIPKIIADAQDGNFEFLKTGILPILIFDQTQADGMYFSVICAEDADYSSTDYNLANLPKEISSYEENDLNLFSEMCSIWGVERLPDNIDNPVQSSIPVLLLSGKYDPITPPDYAQIAAEGLSNKQLIEFPTGSHGQILTNECANKMMLAFIENPSNPVDSKCVQQALEFTLPGDILSVPLLKILFSPDISNLLISVFWVGLLFLSMLALFSAAIVYPINWLVQRNKNQLPDQLDQDIPLTSNEPPDILPKRSVLMKFSPWLVIISAVILFLFLITFSWTVYSLVLQNNPIILFGIPASYWPIFLLPLIFLVLAAFIILISILKWIGRNGTIAGRIYYSLLAIAALAAAVSLSQLGLLGVLFSAV